MAALVALFLWDARLLDPLNFIGGGEVELAHYWYKSYLRERLSDFSLPLWAPQFFAGHPFLASAAGAGHRPSDARRLRCGAAD